MNEIFTPMRKRRLELKMKQSEVAQLMRDVTGFKIPISSISSWEHGAVPKNEKKLNSLAKILKCSPLYLQGISSDVDGKIIDESLDNKHKRLPELLVTNDNIKLYNGEPVWVESNGLFLGKWGIVDVANNCIVFSKTETILIDEAQGQIFLHPNPFTYTSTADIKPLNIEQITDINKYDKVWVECIGCSFDAKRLIKGWYQYNNQFDCVMNNQGGCLPMIGYYKTWLAFKEPVVY